MTGQYPARNSIGLREPLTGSEKDDSLGLSRDIPTLSSLLKSSGYKTALYGKWHLGKLSKYLPSQHGFDHFFGSVYGGIDYVSHKYYDGRNALYKNDLPVKEDGYLTDLITNHTMEFIEQAHDSPFFISLQYTAPHTPWQSPGDNPTPLSESAVDWEKGGSPQIYADMVTNLDYNIGRVLNTLKEQDLEKSTLVIFTSDNGGLKFANNSPFTGNKGHLWEGGIRVPAAIRWPGRIPEGIVSDQPLITMDWTRTILGVANVKINDSMSMDGIDLLQHCLDPKSLVSRKFFWRVSNYRSHSAFRYENYKYLKIENEEFLFNLLEDPGETNDLKKELPGVFKQLKNQWTRLNREMLEPIKYSRNSKENSDLLSEDSTIIQ